MLDVKRCVVVSELTKQKLKDKVGLDFQNGLAKIVKKTKNLTENELDNQAGSDWHTRLEEYNRLRWQYTECSIDDIGVWDRAGGLPSEWCIGSLRETVNCVPPKLKKRMLSPNRTFSMATFSKFFDTVFEPKLFTQLYSPKGQSRQPAPFRFILWVNKMRLLNNRAKYNIPFIVQNIDTILECKFLAPIVVPGGTFRRPPPFKKMKGDIDDGCVRAITLALMGHEKFHAYVGQRM